MLYLQKGKFKSLPALCCHDNSEMQAEACSDVGALTIMEDDNVGGVWSSHLHLLTRIFLLLLSHTDAQVEHLVCDRVTTTLADSW